MVWNEVLLSVATPAIAGSILYIGHKRLERFSGWIATLSALICIFLILGILNPVVEAYSTGGNPIVFEFPWVAQSNVGFGFIIDMLNYPIALIVAAVTALSCFYSVRYMEKEQDQGASFASLLFILTGMIGVVFALDLIQFYLFWELMLIPSYLVIVRQGTSNKRFDVGFKYFIYTHLGALLLLLGIVTMFSYTGTFNLAELPQRAQLIPPEMSPVIFGLLLLGFLVKMAVFPLHTWLPDTYSEVPPPIAAVFSGGMASVAAYGMIRILMTIFLDQIAHASNYLMALGVVTILYGGLVALSQTDIRRLLAYSSISQAGYTLFGLATLSPLGVTGTLLQTANQAICKALLFLCAGSIMWQTGTEDMRRARGLTKKMPIISAACLIGAFSLAGVPPLMGFWSEWMILAGAIGTGNLVFALAAAIGMIVTAGYLLFFIWRVLFGRATKVVESAAESPRSLMLPAILLASLALLIGVWPSILLEFMRPAANYLCAP